MNPLKEDLNLIIDRSKKSLEMIKSKSIFITGGTGFLGKWILETLIHANTNFNYNIKTTVLSRNPEKFHTNFPHLTRGVNFVSGDITNFAFPKENFDFIIHAATSTNAHELVNQPSLVLDNLINGMRRVLAFAEQANTMKMLNISSGAVYGKQPYDTSHVSEDYIGAPTVENTNSAYGEGKRIAELMGNIFAKHKKCNFTTARCFAFAGAYLPLDQHFAIGNFILDGLKNRDIAIKGDGTTHRSYLYAGDLVVWLLQILTHGNSGISYNVGSDQSISIKDLAFKVKEHFPDINVKIDKTSINDNYERYVPNTNKAKNELGLQIYTSLEESIKKMILWGNR